ncbi:hypothetical protein Tco_1101527 [Tanacetum coccineum]
MKCRVESLMRYYEGGFTSPKRPYQEEFEGKILKLIDDQEDQIKQLEEDMRKTKYTFMCLVDSLIAALKVKIEAQRVHSTQIEKITRFLTHTPSIIPKTLKPTMVHRVLMISKIEPTIYRTPHQYLNSNLKMPILHSFKESKLEYEDKDEVKIKMMGTGMDKESLEHNLYKNDITSSICHNFSLTLNPPIKPKDSGNFRMKVQIFYDHVDYTTQMAINHAAGGRLRKLRSKEAWETIEDLDKYEEEEWNEPIFSEKGSPDYIDANLKQELKSMERRVESLMRSEVLLYLASWKGICGNNVSWVSFGDQENRLDTETYTIISLTFMLTKSGDGIASIKRRRHDLRSDGVSTLMTPSELGRPKGNLEDSVSRD